MAQHFMNRDYGFMGWGYYYGFGYFAMHPVMSPVPFPDKRISVKKDRLMGACPSFLENNGVIFSGV